MTWEEFARQDPELAALGQERLDRYGLVMIATLRKNGWPRISPVEPLFFNGHLYPGHDVAFPEGPGPAARPALHNPQRCLGPSRQRG